MRADHRALDQLRHVDLTLDPVIHAEGSCMIKMGKTHVLCTASLDSTVPPWLRGKNTGWVTAEYGMLPRSTSSRSNREAVRGKQSGRSQEIQRLIGRSLRACIDLKALGERQIIIDCDVLQADGGTRCAAITGGWVALTRCIQTMIDKGLIESNPIQTKVAGVSCGINQEGQALLDLDYAEDSTALVDGNYVFTETGELIEVQTSAEKGLFNEEQLLRLLRLARIGCNLLFKEQQYACS